MKGKFFGATMLVIVLALVLAVPASAGKPPPPAGPITVTVGSWSYKNICAKGICQMATDVTARGITWSNASAANHLIAGLYICDVGTAPGPGMGEGCVNWTERYRQSITATQGKLPSKNFTVEWSECYDYYPAILLVNVTDSQTEVLARALGPKIAGFCF